MLPLMVVKSPRCDEMVTLPAGLTPESRVRCPFSKEEFLVQEILDQLPPMLEVVDGPAPAVPATSAGAMAATMVDDAPTDTGADSAVDSGFGFIDTAEKSSGPAQLDETPKGSALFEPEAGSAQPAASSFDFAASDAAEDTATADGTAAAPARRKARPRGRKKPKNPTAEVVKIVLGGIAGLIIAQMIMWWGMKRDPFNLAPKLPSWLPVAPAALRNPEAQPQQPAGGDETAQNGTGQENQNGQDIPIDEVAAAEPYDPNKPFDVPGSGVMAPDVVDDADHNAPAPGENGNGGDNGGAHTAVADDDPPVTLPEDPPPATTAELLVGVRSAPFYTADELGTALKNANDEKDAITAEGGMDLKKQAQRAADFYRVLCKLGETITFVDETGSQVPERVAAAEGIFVALSEKKSNLDAMGRFGATWLRLGEDRPGNGIVLAGTVRSIAPQGKLFDTELQLFAGDEPVVTVMTKIDPRDTYAVGDRVIILGSVVEDPSLKLAGYEGNLPVVTWGGYPVILPKAPAKGGSRPPRGGQPRS